MFSTLFLLRLIFQIIIVVLDRKSFLNLFYMFCNFGNCQFGIKILYLKFNKAWKRASLGPTLLSIDNSLYFYLTSLDIWEILFAQARQPLICV